ncbi:hypothetical protein SAMN05421882_1001154 [Nitrosomonas communis]|uniref:Uncharacterized protein n=1 Tax=Nitrosomonas communis TaxID=44574 RepID=A0A1H2PZS9_9PROT|nr:hypothetical protein SAMN05421882_1001154 [Nitrosomonas communis]
MVLSNIERMGREKINELFPHLAKKITKTGLDVKHKIHQVILRLHLNSWGVAWKYLLMGLVGAFCIGVSYLVFVLFLIMYVLKSSIRE